MKPHNSIGTIGEQLAEQYLLKNDYAILERNWRHGRYEADIIAYIDGTVVFVEVKTRSSVEYGYPEDFVDSKKQRAYLVLANQYMIEHNRNEEARFDIISVILDNNNRCQINHIVGAFSPHEWT